MTVIALDFETYCDLDLNKVGLMNYVRHPSFKVLMVVTQEEGMTSKVWDFVLNPDDLQSFKQYLNAGNTLIAHNMMFERAVFRALGLRPEHYNWIDSAVIARAAGASGTLANASKQLLGSKKLDDDRALVRFFCTPQPGESGFQMTKVTDNLGKWGQFKMYCARDTELAFYLWRNWNWVLTQREHVFAYVTTRMNETGWKVDRDLLDAMDAVYHDNMDTAVRNFRVYTKAHDLNLNSHVQLQKWCADRGVNSKSFDEQAVERVRKALQKRMTTPAVWDKLPEDQKKGYREVLYLMETKQILGGSSLKKLDIIRRTMADDDRLYDQYVHCGAGQTLRTSGRGAQLQNLKRLGKHPDNVEQLLLHMDWDNEMLARNIRQLFLSKHQLGVLMVGDFSSVESRGLAWLANAFWKTDAFRNGLDLYKVQAMKIFHIDSYDQVSDEQRQTGKVGELSCGYQAGPGAVKDFAAKLGVDLTEAEAAALVNDWRAANPEIVAFWELLQEGLEHVLAGRRWDHQLPDGMLLTLEPIVGPVSLPNGKDKSLAVSVSDSRGNVFMRRFFHGIYERSGNIAYHKPSENKGGALWWDGYVDPKTKQWRYYEIYGGKLAGILTQSLCREIFMRVTNRLFRAVSSVPNAELIGQFHDELVLDTWPDPASSFTQQEIETLMKQHMEHLPELPSFPLAAEIKSGHRYIK